MKITLKKIIYLIALVSVSFSAKAQYSAVPDTGRITIGLDGGLPDGPLGTEYKFVVGASLQADIPYSDKLYFTGNIGYDNFSPNNSSFGSNSEAIQGVVLANMQVAPVKVGIKYFLIRTFYVQAEIGEYFLLNKSAVYALNGNSLVYAPQFGILFKLKNKRYIDAGFRLERFQSFYGDGGYINFTGLRVAYGLNW
jgi:hypothetical protein